MFWITKYRHNKIVEQYIDTIKDLREALFRKEKFEEICEKLTDKVNVLVATEDYVSASASVMDRLDDTVPRYVDDYFGGKVIRQEATPVTILDSKGKASYGVTKQDPDEGKKFILIHDKNN